MTISAFQVSVDQMTNLHIYVQNFNSKRLIRWPNLEVSVSLSNDRGAVCAAICYWRNPFGSNCMLILCFANWTFHFGRTKLWRHPLVKLIKESKSLFIVSFYHGHEISLIILHFYHFDRDYYCSYHWFNNFIDLNLSTKTFVAK